MISFKKNTIFSREPAEKKEDEILHGGVLAVWGSPGSGKTTTAVKLAKYLADRKKNVILVLCDMTAPMLPCICLPSDLDCFAITSSAYNDTSAQPQTSQWGQPAEIPEEVRIL